MCVLVMVRNATTKESVDTHRRFPRLFQVMKCLPKNLLYLKQLYILHVLNYSF